MSVQPDRKIRRRTMSSDYRTIRQCSDISAEWHREIDKYQNQTAQLIILEIVFHFIPTHVRMRTISDTADMQAERSLPSRP